MQAVTVHDIACLIEQDTSPDWAAEWDNVGLQVGARDWPVHRIWVALDVTRAVIDAAANHRVDMLLTHHPLLFSPLKRLDLSTPLGGVLEKAIRHRLAVYSAHTNLDRMKGGVNDTLARRIGLTRWHVLDGEPGEADLGFSRIGSLDTPLRLEDYVRTVKAAMGLSQVRFSGNPDMRVQTVAVCAGSGSGLVDTFLASDAHVFVSGDLKYHDARKVQDHGRGLIDIGHFQSEHLFLEVWIERLRTAAGQKKMDVIIAPCPEERDPFFMI